MAALAAEIVLLPRLVELDGALWRAVLFARGCDADRAVDWIVTAATRVVMVLLAAATVLSVRGVGVRETWPPLAVCAVGLLTGEFLKNVFMRERPSMIPDVALGHSFPSGHVMNTTLAALAILVLVAGFRHPRRWWAAAALVAIVAAGRLLLGHHWLLDALGSGLAAVALMGLCLPSFRRRPLLAPAVLALALATVLTVDLHWRALEIRLPSPLSALTPRVVEIDVGAALGTAALRGDWTPLAERALGRLGAWLRGAGTVVIEMPAAAGGGGPPSGEDAVPGGRPAELVFAGRPDITDQRCVSLRVAVNGQALAPFVPFVGWREYRLPLPPGTVRPGANEVRIEAVADREAPWRFALVYLRVAAYERYGASLEPGRTSLGSDLGPSHASRDVVPHVVGMTGAGGESPCGS